tara:strand:- start:2074 stop:2673 length:600 start_codon:yes stop_codon:yes gene_type:complete
LCYQLTGNFVKEIIIYSKAQQTSAVNILLLAFSSDPFQRYIMPDPSTYFRNSSIWFKNAIDQSISVEGLWGGVDYSGTGVWFPPKYVMNFEAMEETYNDFPQSIKSNIFKYFEELTRARPDDAWYLEYLGVDPRHQSQGVGSSILKNSLAKIDSYNQPAYLESSNPRNMSLYQRHGFEVQKKIQVGEGPPLHTMYREAR